MRRQAFSLIEIIICLAITAISYTIMLPNLHRLLFKCSALSNMQQIAQAINYGRSLAIRYVREVKLCPSADGIMCGHTWDKGILVISPIGNKTFFKFKKLNGTDLTLKQCGFNQFSLKILKNGLTNQNGNFNYSNLLTPDSMSYTLYFNKALRLYVKEG